MIRTLDATFLNSVANDDSVRPDIGGEGVLDLSPLVGNPQNYALIFDHGGFVAVRHEAGVYEVHTLFLPDGRGESAMRSAEAAFQYMFTRTDCIELVTKVPFGNKAARVFTKANGFTERFSCLSSDHFGITIEQWALRSQHALVAGRQFHEKLEAVKVATNSPLLVHDDDDTHDQVAGAAYLMVAGGAVSKAVWFYNKWARLSGYDEIGLVSTFPPVIDIVDAVLESRDGKMEVILCR